jgi:hypothetical protein
VSEENEGEPFRPVSDTYAHNPQTVDAWRSTLDGEIVAVERGVTHGARFTVTRFAAPIWEEREPLEYHGRTDDRAEAEEIARDVLRAKADD